MFNQWKKLLRNGKLFLFQKFNTMETKLQTERKIQETKRTFQEKLAKKLQLHKISSPLMVMDGTGVNDDLNGCERPVKFKVKSLQDQQAVVVHSLAKWKRMQLKDYEIPLHEGILTDMQALRPDEDYSPLHSIYVDQWDWEMHISKADRTIDFLKATVRKIFSALKETETELLQEKIIEKEILPKEIHFISAEDLYKLYPDISPKEREHLIAKEYSAIFIIGIGGELSCGIPHDGRAADYDDWSTPTELGYGLNGDLIVWSPILDQSIELSSMGIRVDKTALLKQLEIRSEEEKSHLNFHQQVLSETLPYSIGGGIGQSRICMFMLQKKHIGEVQSSVWDEKVKSELLTQGIRLM